MSCIESGHQGCAEKGDSSGWPGYSSCSGVSKEPRNRRGSENQHLVTVGQPEAWSIFMEPEHEARKPVGATTHIKKPLAPTMAPGNWGRRRSGRCTAQAVRCGRCPWLGSAVGCPRPRRRRRGRRSTVGSLHSPHCTSTVGTGRCSPPWDTGHSTQVTRSAVLSQNR